MTHEKTFSPSSSLQQWRAREIATSSFSSLHSNPLSSSPTTVSEGNSEKMARFSPLISLLILLAACCAPVPSDGQSNFTLNILHTSGVRGQFFPSTSRNVECTIAEAESNTTACLGGCARRQAFIDRERNRAPAATLVVDSGSYSLLSTYNYTVAAECINRAKYDAIAIGTSDFYACNVNQSSSAVNIAAYLDLISNDTAIVSLSSDMSADPFLRKPRPYAGRDYGPRQGKAQRYMIKTMGTRRVAVLGLLSALTAINVCARPLRYNQEVTLDVNGNINSTRELSLIDVELELQVAIFEVMRDFPDVNIFVVVVDNELSSALRYASISPHIDVVLLGTFRERTFCTG